MRGMPDAQVDYVDFAVYHHELELALRFTPADLEANRQGRLSMPQRVLLVKDDAKRIAAAIVSIVVGVGCVLLALAIGITTELSARILLLVPAAVAVAGLLSWISFRFWEDIRRGEVCSVEGFVTPTDKLIQTGTAFGPVLDFFWVVGQQRFRVPGNAYPVLTPARHRIYFLPLTRKIVAVEPTGRDSVAATAQGGPDRA